MIKIKDKLAISKMRKAGHLLAEIFEILKEQLLLGKTTLDLNNFIEDLMLERSLKPVCKGYAGYKHATCISLNDVIVHGVPSKDVVIKNGDLVKVDVVGSYEGYCADMTRCFFVGDVSETAKKLVSVAQNALDKAIAIIKPGIHLSDISSEIQKEVEKANFGIVRTFSGHGIGKSLHEQPEIPNFGRKGLGPILRVGMTLAIEPMITEKSFDVKIDNDGWTARTADGGLSGHVEDTIAVTENGAEILTRV